MPDTNYGAEKLEAQKRFETLPEVLKKEILADKNVELIYSVCKDYSIPEDKIKHVVLLVGEVFLGYIKPEEIAHELTTYFDIDLQKANFIEIELKQKLFNGLKNDLDKIYDPIKITESEITDTETAPVVINFGSDAQQLDNQKPTTSPLTIGNIPNQPTQQNRMTIAEQEKTEISSAIPKNIPEQSANEAMPFIIHTKTEAVKAATPQFPRETPSLNLKVDPSIIQKNPIVKPIPVHLETAQPVQEKRFQMPVIAGQKIFSSAPAIEKIPEKQDGAAQSLRVPPKQSIPEIATSQTPARTTKVFQSGRPRNDGKVLPTILTHSEIKIKPIQTNPLPNPEPINLQGRPMELKQSSGAIEKKTNIIQKKASPVFEEINIPIQQKTIPVPTQPAVAPSLKQLSEQKTTSTTVEQKTVMPEPAPSTGSGQAKIVHYSTFKTELSPLGAPKKPEPKKDDFINLNTFMRVNGNTVDLRSNQQPTTNN